MIKLIDNGPDDSQIQFRARPKSKASDITRKLIYGFECPWCANVVQALFLTDEPVKLNLYEETRVISQMGKDEGLLNKIVPNTDDTDSAYKTDFYQTAGGNAVLLRLKNHVINWKGLGPNSNPEYFFEVGPRCCKYTGFYPLQEEKAVAELERIVGYSSYQDLEGPIPLDFLNIWAPAASYATLDFRILLPVGQANRLVLINRNVVKTQNASWPLNDIRTQWNKLVAEKKAAEKESSDVDVFD